MPISVLITQCLQRDFVDLVAPHEPLPNKLHVGREEALRLLGPDPRGGPVAQLMNWARAQDPSALKVIHIRDWHDPSDPRQNDHLATFGNHCVRNTPGAALVIGLEDGVAARSNEKIVDALTLSDFEDTDLPQVIARIQEEAKGEPLRVGVVGVWTEAKVSFLLYDLKTRCRIDELATCSALTASASRAQHFNALEQMQKILGVSCFDSVGDFAEWLLPHGIAPRLPSLPKSSFRAKLELPAGGEIAQADRDILGYLYRDSSRVSLSALSGGFSGARVFRVNSWDAFGHEQAASVAKLGPRNLIGAERAAFERVESVLGNNAPSVRGFVDLGDKAGIKYAFAAMGQGNVRTLKSLFETQASQSQIDVILRAAFEEILGRLYSAAQYERLPLLEHYRFHPGLAKHVRPNVEAIAGPSAAKGSRISFDYGFEAMNLCTFYEDFLPAEPAEPGEYHFVSYVHGDLNGANILIDGRENVWVIDFFHTGRGHVLKDVAKLENDLLYIFTPVNSEAELKEGLKLTAALRKVQDLREALPEKVEGVQSWQFVRAWNTIRTLRAIGGRLCRSDRDPRQMNIALLRYSAHTLAFDESNALQRRWALAGACGQAEDIVNTTRSNRRIRIDWIESPVLPKTEAAGKKIGRLGMTICPGRKDRGRDLVQDLSDLRESGTSRLLCLTTDEELDWAGVPGIRDASERAGLKFHQLAIRDQGVPAIPDAERLVSWILEGMEAGEDVVLHCMGGLGRTGTVAACVLVARGAKPEDAIAAVRASRGPRTIELPEQARFVSTYAAAR